MVHESTRTLRETFLPKTGRREAAQMSPTDAAWLAWYMCFLSLGLSAFGLILLVLSREHHGAPVFEQWAEDAVVAIGFSTVGALVAPRFPAGNPVGWLFCAIGLVGAVLLFSGEYAAYSLLARSGSLPAGEAFAWLVSWLWVVHAGLFAFLGLLFPDGRPSTPRWRAFAWFLAAALVLGSVAAAYSPGPIDTLAPIRNPLGIEGAPNLTTAVEVVVFTLTLASAASLWLRLRQARGVERQQIMWFAYAASVLAVGAFVGW